MAINIWTYMFEPPGPAFSDSKDTKFNWPEMSGIPDLADYPLFHEVLGDIVYFTDIANTEPINYEVKFYNNNTGKLISFMSAQVPTPASQGWEWWDWFKIKSMIGRASWEIDGPMRVRIEIRVFGWIFNESRTFYMDVINTAPPTEIKETITWQAFVPDGENDFKIFSVYGIDVDGTPEGFIKETWTGKLVKTSSMTREDTITRPIPSQVDCLTTITQGYTPLDRIYDWKIDTNVI